MLKKGFLLLLFICLIPTGQSFSFESKGQDCTKCHTLSKEDAEILLRRFSADLKVFEVRLSPLKALWEIFYESSGKKGILYVDLAKNYLVSGSVISIKDKKNLTQATFSELNKVDVSKIPLDDALVMGDPKARLRVVVFTDPD